MKPEPVAKYNKRYIWWILKPMLFLIIAYQIFLHCTYLFRDTSHSGRGNILGFYQEEKDTIDVVYIGASSVYRYCDPMKAYALHGFTSYSYSVSNMHPASVIYAVDDVLKYQNPKLFVIDVRMLLSRVDITLQSMRDSVDFGFKSLRMVHYYCDLFDIPLKDRAIEYIDLIQYHNNEEALASAANWEMMDNRVDHSMDINGFYKGFAISDRHNVMNAPAATNGEISGEGLDPKKEKILRDFLKFCNSKDMEVLLVATPYGTQGNDNAEFELMGTIAEEYGYPMLNANLSYGQIGLDFTEDFYDVNHVNIIGAEKFTEFLSDYLSRHYNLPDHRKDPSYSSWNESLQGYERDAGVARTNIQQVLESQRQALEAEKAMKTTMQACQWLSLADNKNMTIFVQTQGIDEEMICLEDRLMFKYLGLFSQDTLSDAQCFMGVYSGGIVLADSTGEKSNDGKVGSRQLPYSMQIGDKVQIVIDSEQVIDDPRAGIYMVAFDNNYNEVVDCVRFFPNEKGKIGMERLFSH